MALVLKDRVRETSTTTGTGTFTLAGAVAGFQSFSAIGTGNSTYYTIVSTSDWEVGIGTWTSPDQLSRDTVLASTNAGALVTFGSGTKDVFVTLPSERATYLQDLGNRIVITNPVVPANEGVGVIECVDDGLGDGYNDLRIYSEDSFGAKYAPFFNAGIASANFVIRSQDWTTNYQYVQLNVPSGMSSSYTLTLPTTAGSNNQVLKTDGSGNLSWANKFVLGAGTSTAGTAPLKFTSGTNLTTAEAGAMEYDGNVAYFTPSGTARALNFTPYYFRNNSQVTLNNATGNQSVLGLTNGVTLVASTIYEVECEFKLTTSGTTSHTEAFGFAGTATANNVHISMTRQNSFLTSGTAGNGANFYTAIAVNVVTAAITTAQEVTYKMRGNISVNASGTFRPVIAFSAAPGGTSTIAAGAWFRVTPLGASGSNISIGTWS